jgi:hypothetical protein
MTSQADTVYGRRPWGSPPVQIQKPNQTHEQYLTGLALESAMSMTADQIRQIRPPVPVQLFPPRFGYRTEALGIEDIINVDQIYQRTDFAQYKSGMEGTSTPALNVW